MRNRAGSNSDRPPSNIIHRRSSTRLLAKAYCFPELPHQIRSKEEWGRCASSQKSLCASLGLKSRCNRLSRWTAASARPCLTLRATRSAPVLHTAWLASAPAVLPLVSSYPSSPFPRRDAGHKAHYLLNGEVMPSVLDDVCRGFPMGDVKHSDGRTIYCSYRRGDGEAGEGGPLTASVQRAGSRKWFSAVACW
jgi:hypothetical protein